MVRLSIKLNMINTFENDSFHSNLNMYENDNLHSNVKTYQTDNFPSNLNNLPRT